MKIIKKGIAIFVQDEKHASTCLRYLIEMGFDRNNMVGRLHNLAYYYIIDGKIYCNNKIDETKFNIIKSYDII